MSPKSYPSEWKDAQGTLSAHVSGAPDGPWTYALNVKSGMFQFDGRLEQNTLELTELRIDERDWRKLSGRRFKDLIPEGKCVTPHGYHERVDVRSITFGPWDGRMGSVTCVLECDFSSRYAHFAELVVFTAQIEFTGVGVGMDRWVWQPNSTQHDAIAQALRVDRTAAKQTWQRMRSEDAVALATRSHDMSAYQLLTTEHARPWFSPV